MREYLNDRDVTYVNEVYKQANAKLPWWSNPDKIPSEDMAEAQALAKATSETDSEYEWRMRHYKNLRIGWSWTVRRAYPWFMKSHADAMEFIRKMCSHTYGEKVYGGSRNEYLGTYENGYKETCTKCGYINDVTTSFNNWSGD